MVVTKTAKWKMDGSVQQIYRMLLQFVQKFPQVLAEMVNMSPIMDNNVMMEIRITLMAAIIIVK